MSTKTIYHRIKALNARMAANYRRGFGPTRMVLLLTTIGRKSGLPRVTPLQFEQVDGAYYVASARIADFIELRLRRHPVMVRLIMHLFDGLPLRFSRADLEAFCKEKALAILHPRPAAR